MRNPPKPSRSISPSGKLRISLVARKTMFAPGARSWVVSRTFALWADAAQADLALPFSRELGINSSRAQKIAVSLRHPRELCDGVPQLAAQKQHSLEEDRQG